MSYYDNAGDGDYKPANGRYTAELADGGAFVSRKGTETLKFVWRILDGPDAGREFDDMMYPSSRNLDIVRDKIAMLGVDTSKIERFEDHDTAIAAVVGLRAELSVSNNGDWCNVTVNGTRTGKSDVTPANGAGGDPFAAAASATADDDDIPFAHDGFPELEVRRAHRSRF